ncbi:molybdopterin molybdotransferase MoeA [Sphingopyxis sp. MWB1]|uniref:molybdopterin molybdotransferase MoeA n=1 Tax=Sphingopyxis sp. MWB1 TaxID=1537715 RepID=UPI00051A1E04|nr:molybdopterin molybdotransferase MoeA [Sphingopyxis sp. MWB1]
MSGLLAVEQAQTRPPPPRPPLPPEEIAVTEATGRYISDHVIAARDQPAAPLSAMDGYAIRFADMPGPWRIAGEVAAGTAPTAALAPDEAIRIFTGAMLPAGADTVIVQEDVTAKGSDLLLSGEGPGAAGRHVRAAGGDFRTGDRLLARGTRLTPGAIAAAIMGGAARFAVGARPRIAILATGDELVAPGTPLAPGQIPDSNGIMLAAMLAPLPVILGESRRVPDSRAALATALAELASRHDIIVTIGGASVGDHDHVAGALADAGGTLDFWKIAMRPGKPLIAGRIGDAVLLGLPGNPASAFVTATLFLLPLARHLAGAADPLPRIRQAPLAAPLGPGKARREYLRARLTDDGLLPFTSQDSGQTRPLAEADALLIREIGAPPAPAGSMAPYIGIA